ncbi:uncharacterized protein LOC123655998 [Melitaea cinxia]|uniref:uncharacterized protein LOC123655998 n=1 Tax=Melitaea cinxia TaxID=113334 RepID=UPI001E272713|nr:uncharacterized protein LOC123655998 [Melitaea cinxia]
MSLRPWIDETSTSKADTSFAFVSLTIDFFAESLEELGLTLSGLHESRRISHRMNLEKVIFNNQVILRMVSIDSTLLEVFQNDVYLGHNIQLARINFEKEADGRIRLGWTSFCRLRRVLTSKIENESVQAIHPAWFNIRCRDWTLRKELSTSFKSVTVQPWIVSVFIYQNDVYLGHNIQLARINFEKEADGRIRLGWTSFGRLRRVLTSKIENESVQAIHPACFNIRCLDWTPRKELSTSFKSLTVQPWICRKTSGHWRRRVPKWRPRVGKRSVVGYPPARWIDDLHKASGGVWMRITENWNVWV